MGSIPRIIGVMSCSVVLSLSLSNATQAAERVNSNPCGDREGGLPNLMTCEGKTPQGIDTITGEVLRIDGNDFLIQRFNGKEVRLHLNASTEMTEIIGRGDRIEAKLNDQKHVLSIRHLEH
jgi:hypothetical protein